VRKGKGERGREGTGGERREEEKGRGCAVLKTALICPGHIHSGVSKGGRQLG